MQFPTIQKPKSKKLEGAEVPKQSFSDTIKSYTDESIGKGEKSAKPIRTAGDRGITAKVPMEEEDDEMESPEFEAEEAADNAMKAVGSDKSDKASMIRARAMLIKAKASKK